MSHWALLLCLLFACAACVDAASLTKTVTLTDYLGDGWQQELVHYPLNFPPGALAHAVVRVEVKGGKALSSQLSDVTRYDDGSLRSCNVWFLADVPANGSVSYTLSPGKKGAADAGVAVKTEGNYLTLTTTGTALIGIRLPAGAQAFVWPLPAAEVPGPIQGLLLPSGRVTGAGRLAVPFKVKAYKTEVTADGPLFAEAKVSYTFDAGYWTFTARVVKDCPMVQIQEQFDNGFDNRTWDQADRFYTLTLNGAQFKPTQAFYTGRTEADSFHDLLNQYFQPVLNDTGGSAASGSGTPVNGYTLSFQQDRTDYYLTPWPTWSPRAGVAIRFVEPGKDAIGFTSVSTTDWKNPLAMRFQTNTKGELVAAMPLQTYRQGWPSEGFGYHSPNYTGKSLFVPETTSRRNYGIMLTPAEDETKTHIDSLLHLTAKLGAAPLDEVKDWTLDWPDPLANATWATATSKEGKAALAITRNWMRSYRALGNYGFYSMWTFRSLTHNRYLVTAPVIDNTKALTAADRRELRHLCAYQAYVLNSMGEFPWGAGPHLGNPNMSIMAMDARAKSALLVKDHPQYNQWGAWTLAFTKNYIERFTRETGAPYEDPHYTLGVTLQEIAEVNQALQEAGIGDALDTPRFKACMRFLLDWSLPPDPRFLNRRLTLAYGNGSSYYSVPPEFARLMVEYYKDRDPKLAAQLQWFANQTLPDEKQVKIVTEEAPVLRSVYHTDEGVFFHHGYGTPYETYFFFKAGNCDGHYELETDQMTYTLYAKGQPINLHFGNGYMPMFMRPWLRNRVTIDHMFEESERNITRMTATALQPEADYAHATRDIDSIRPLKTEYPLTTNKGLAWAPEENASWPQIPEWQRIPLTVWHRQALFLKDADPRGPNYFVLRDTFAGAPTRPTDLSCWFLANSMTRKGDVYHFDGQCKVDMDVFVAQPAGTAPETGKYGHPQYPYGRMIGFDPKFFPDGKLQETQLFLRLKQPVGKGYLVVLYPRLKDGDPEARYTAPADGVVRVETPLATDFVFLNPTLAGFSNDQVTFSGTAGAVRCYKSGKIAVINTEGEARFTVAGKTISGSGIFTVSLDHDAVTVTPTDAKVTVK